MGSNFYELYMLRIYAWELSGILHRLSNPNWTLKAKARCKNGKINAP